MMGKKRKLNKRYRWEKTYVIKRRKKVRRKGKELKKEWRKVSLGILRKNGNKKDKINKRRKKRKKEFKKKEGKKYGKKERKKERKRKVRRKDK